MSKRRTERDADLRADDSFPSRWVELGSADPSSSPENDIERRIGALLEKVPPPPALGRAAHDRVQARLRDSRRPERTLAASWIGRLAMGSGLGAFSLILGGAVVAAGGVGAWWKISQTNVPSPPVIVMAREQIPRNMPRHPRPRTVARADRADALGQVTPESASEPAPPLEAQPVEPSRDLAIATVPPRPRALASAPSRAAERAPGSTELAQETRLLGGALAALRQQHDGAAALATLDEYLGRFPTGILLGEARRARIDALLLLGRKDDAQSALDRLDLEPVGRGQELMLIRGELRARHQCADAIADFDVVLGHAASPPLAERALFGRAACRQQEGQGGAARADALAYLDRFPAGRFAGAARQLLAAGRIPRDDRPTPMSPEGGL